MTDLSEDEFSFLQNPYPLQLKQNITFKLTSILKSVSDDLKVVLEKYSDPLGMDLLQSTPKISKGENYLGLPYYVLDYPRRFKKEDIFLFRVMIWWGNEISFSLLLSGKSLRHFRQPLVTNIQKENLFFSISPTPWVYHFEKTNFVKINDLTLRSVSEHIDTFGFVKLANKVALEEIADINSIAVEHLARFLMYLK